MTIREAAEIYASALVEGDEIVDEIDEAIIGRFRHLLPGLLAKRGLQLMPHRERAGVKVIEQAPWLKTLPRYDYFIHPSEGQTTTLECPNWMALRFRCGVCGRSWFDSDCDHGVRVVVSCGEKQEPFTVMKPAQA